MTAIATTLPGTGLRVLCVTPWFPNSDADARFNFIYHSVRSLVAAGHAVSVLVTRPWTPAPLGRLNPHWAHAAEPVQVDLQGAGAPIEVARFFSAPGYLFSGIADDLYRLSIGSRITRLIQQRNIQLVHAHTERAGMCAVAVAGALGVPSVLTLHGISTAPQLLDTAAKRARLSACLNNASRVALVGEPLRDYYRTLGGHATRFRIVPNGFFLHGVERRSAPWGSTVRFVSVSNLDEGKGIDINLQAFARLKEAGFTDWTYWIIGGGPDRAALEGLAATLGLADQVTFVGELAHDRTMERLAQGDVFVLPSYREAFGVAYIEAMALGLLAVGVEGQGPEAFIRHGISGLLVKPKDHVALSQAMVSILERRNDMQQIAEAGHRAVHAEFTWARHAEKLTAVFEEALGAP